MATEAATRRLPSDARGRPETVTGGVGRGREVEEAAVIEKRPGERAELVARNHANNAVLRHIFDPPEADRRRSGWSETACPRGLRAQAGTRTRDLILTKNVLCQLSYLGTTKAG